MARRSTEELVNDQIRRWEKRRETESKEAVQRPMITISSAYGSYGWAIGRQVGEVLGFDVYDRELIERIAASARVRQMSVETLDERVRDWISEHLASLFKSEELTPSDFIRHLSLVVLTLGRHGRGVIIGRGAQFILKPELTLRVRTTAPFDVRLRNAGKEDQDQDARALVLRKDASRQAFARLHFNKNVDDPDSYDLIINSGDGALKRHAELIAYAFSLRFGIQR